MELELKSSPQGSNPILAIAVAIALAISMVVVTFSVFIHSGAYTTVKQIQTGTEVARSAKISGYDTGSSIKASDIAKYEEAMVLKLNSFSDEADFGQAQINDSALGLK